MCYWSMFNLILAGLESVNDYLVHFLSNSFYIVLAKIIICYSAIFTLDHNVFLGIRWTGLDSWLALHLDSFHSSDLFYLLYSLRGA
jgi:hypothetical protein